MAKYLLCQHYRFQTNQLMEAFQQVSVQVETGSPTFTNSTFLSILAFVYPYFICRSGPKVIFTPHMTKMLIN